MPASALPAASPEVAYRPLSDDLDRICCFKYGRIVAADNTIRFGGRSLQLGPVGGRRNLARTRVEVHERLDGSLLVLWRGESVATAGSRILTDLPDPDVSGPLSDRPPPQASPAMTNRDRSIPGVAGSDGDKVSAHFR